MSFPNAVRILKNSEARLANSAEGIYDDDFVLLFWENVEAKFIDECIRYLNDSAQRVIYAPSGGSTQFYDSSFSDDLHHLHSYYSGSEERIYRVMLKSAVTSSAYTQSGTRWKLLSGQTYESGTSNLVLAIYNVNPNNINALQAESIPETITDQIYLIGGTQLTGTWYNVRRDSEFNSSTGLYDLRWFISRYNSKEYIFRNIDNNSVNSVEFFKHHMTSDAIDDFEENYYFDSASLGIYYYSTDSKNYTKRNNATVTDVRFDTSVDSGLTSKILAWDGSTNNFYSTTGSGTSSDPSYRLTYVDALDQWTVYKTAGDTTSTLATFDEATTPTPGDVPNVGPSATFDTGYTLARDSGYSSTNFKNVIPSTAKNIITEVSGRNISYEQRPNRENGEIDISLTIRFLDSLEASASSDFQEYTQTQLIKRNTSSIAAVGTPPDGTIITMEATPNPDGTFDTVRTTRVFTGQGAAGGSTNAIRGEAVLITNNDSSALGTPADQSDGTILIHESEQLPNNLYRNIKRTITARTDVATVTDNTEVSDSGAGGYVESTVKKFNQSSGETIAESETAAGTIVTVENTLNEDGTFNTIKRIRTERETTASSGNKSLLNSETVTITNNASSVLGQPSGSASAGVVKVNESQQLENGLFRNIERVITSVANDGSTDKIDQTSSSETIIRKYNQSSPESHDNTEEANGTTIIIENTINPDGTFNTVKRTRIDSELTAEGGSTTALNKEEIIITVNAAAELGEPSDQADGIIISHQSEQLPNGLFRNTQRKVTARTDVADVTDSVESSDFNAGGYLETVTKKFNQSSQATIDESDTAAGNIITVENTINEDGTFNTIKRVRTDRETIAASGTSNNFRQEQISISNNSEAPLSHPSDQNDGTILIHESEQLPNGLYRNVSRTIIARTDVATVTDSTEISDAGAGGYLETITKKFNQSSQATISESDTAAGSIVTVENTINDDGTFDTIERIRTERSLTSSAKSESVNTSTTVEIVNNATAALGTSQSTPAAGTTVTRESIPLENGLFRNITTTVIDNTRDDETETQAGAYSQDVSIEHNRNAPTDTLTYVAGAIKSRTIEELDNGKFKVTTSTRTANNQSVDVTSKLQAYTEQIEINTADSADLPDVTPAAGTQVTLESIPREDGKFTNTKVTRTYSNQSGSAEVCYGSGSDTITESVVTNNRSASQATISSGEKADGKIISVESRPNEDGTFNTTKTTRTIPEAGGVVHFKTNGSTSTARATLTNVTKARIAVLFEPGDKLKYHKTDLTLHEFNGSGEIISTDFVSQTAAAPSNASDYLPISEDSTNVNKFIELNYIKETNLYDISIVLNNIVNLFSITRYSNQFDAHEVYISIENSTIAIKDDLVERLFSDPNGDIYVATDASTLTTYTRKNNTTVSATAMPLNAVAFKSKLEGRNIRFQTFYDERQDNYNFQFVLEQQKADSRIGPDPIPGLIMKDFWHLDDVTLERDGFINGKAAFKSIGKRTPYISLSGQADESIIKYTKEFPDVQEKIRIQGKFSAPLVNGSSYPKIFEIKGSNYGSIHIEQAGSNTQNCYLKVKPNGSTSTITSSLVGFIPSVSFAPNEFNIVIEKKSATAGSVTAKYTIAGITATVSATIPAANGAGFNFESIYVFGQNLGNATGEFQGKFYDFSIDAATYGQDNFFPITKITAETFNYHNDDDNLYPVDIYDLITNEPVAIMDHEDGSLVLDDDVGYDGNIYDGSTYYIKFCKNVWYLCGSKDADVEAGDFILFSTETNKYDSSMPPFNDYQWQLKVDDLNSSDGLQKYGPLNSLRTISKILLFNPDNNSSADANGTIHPNAFVLDSAAFNNHHYGWEGNSLIYGSGNEKIRINLISRNDSSLGNIYYWQAILNTNDPLFGLNQITTYSGGNTDTKTGYEYFTDLNGSYSKKWLSAVDWDTTILKNWKFLPIETFDAAPVKFFDTFGSLIPTSTSYISDKSLEISSSPNISSQQIEEYGLTRKELEKAADFYAENVGGSGVNYQFLPQREPNGLYSYRVALTFKKGVTNSVQVQNKFYYFGEKYPLPPTTDTSKDPQYYYIVPVKDPDAEVTADISYNHIDDTWNWTIIEQEIDGDTGLSQTTPAVLDGDFTTKRQLFIYKNVTQLPTGNSSFMADSVNNLSTTNLSADLLNIDTTGDDAHRGGIITTGSFAYQRYYQTKVAIQTNDDGTYTYTKEKIIYTVPAASLNIYGSSSLQTETYEGNGYFYVGCRVFYNVQNTILNRFTAGADGGPWIRYTQDSINTNSNYDIRNSTSADNGSVGDQYGDSWNDVFARLAKIKENITNTPTTGDTDTAYTGDAAVDGSAADFTDEVTAPNCFNWIMQLNRSRKEKTYTLRKYFVCPPPQSHWKVDENVYPAASFDGSGAKRTYATLSGTTPSTVSSVAKNETLTRIGQNLWVVTVEYTEYGAWSVDVRDAIQNPHITMNMGYWAEGQGVPHFPNGSFYQPANTTVPFVTSGLIGEQY